MTAEELERIGDAGKFERLALPVLRELYPECKTLAHLGVNAEGKTIPGPLDAFTRVPGSDPSHYIAASFTTVSTSKLKSKWLSIVPSPSGGEGALPACGDLVKAGNAAASVREVDKNAKFTVYLCTNRRLIDGLMSEVYLAAHGLNIEVVFLEQSLLRDFLDTKPLGQWLRQEHLGIDADQVSAPLLERLAARSLTAYAAEKLLLVDPNKVIRTAAGDAIGAAVGAAASLHLLIGPSGTGKTVIAFDILRRHVADGGVGLWISDEVAARAASLSEAIEETLKALHPAICKGAGARVLELVNADQPLVLVIDDISRGSRPESTLMKTMGWCRGVHPSDAAAASRSSIVTVCPLWDSYSQTLRECLGGASWLRMHFLSGLGEEEAVGCLEACIGEAAARFDKVFLEDLARRLRSSPVMLGLLGERLQHSCENPTTIAEDVIANFAAGVIGELSSQTHLPNAQYDRALLSLGREMVRRRSLYPSWAEVRRWFEDRQPTLHAIEQLAEQRHLCRTVGDRYSPRLEFRHDRVLEHFLSRAVAEMLGDAESERALAADPFFVPHIGRAVPYVEDVEGALDWIGWNAPVALLVALDYAPQSIVKSVVERAHEWLRSWPTLPEALVEDAMDVLQTVRSPHILEVTNGVPENRAIWHARLRVGDAIAGARALATDFFPRANYPWLESLIDNAATMHNAHLVTTLVQTLESPTSNNSERHGALCLAGYLGDARLKPAILAAWNAANDRAGLLSAAVWAGLRCAGDDPEDLLGKVLPSIPSVSDDAPAGDQSPRGSILEDLSSAARHGIGEPALRWLVRLAKADEGCESLVLTLIEKIDHPLAVSYVVQRLGPIIDKARQSGHFVPFGDIWAGQWDPNRDESRALSDASLDAIRSLWESEENSSSVRACAFWVWARLIPHISADPLALARAPQGDDTIWLRALRGDTSVASAVAERIVTNSRWLHVAPAVWCGAVESSVELWLDQTPTAKNRSGLCHQLANCLRDAPREAGLRLLLKHWDRLRNEPIFARAALYFATDETRVLAASAVRNVGAEVVLQHIHHFYGFRVQGLSSKITMEHLESLRPYLAYVDWICMDEMIHLCWSHGRQDWAREHLMPECRRRAADPNSPPQEQQRAFGLLRNWFPTDKDMLLRFDEFQKMEPKRFRSTVWSWLEYPRGADLDVATSFRLLQEWVGASPTLSRYKVVAEVLRYRGARAQLRVLRQGGPDTSTAEYRSLVASAEYRVKRRSLE